MLTPTAVTGPVRTQVHEWDAVSECPSVGPNNSEQSNVGPVKHQ